MENNFLGGNKINLKLTCKLPEEQLDQRKLQVISALTVELFGLVRLTF